MKNNCFKYNTTSPSLKNTINFGKFPYINSAISLSQKKKFSQDLELMIYMVL